ncbi:MAG: 2Fe-2S iron-sulfur cluster-binding protein [Flavobacteriales bacterium]|nr:2Fe-2S iron-sulfur cluster-binding protein [Flavobacteriales bacterium]MDW8432518.1 2Fe-2S iron-sulfur cluster-binding protein [Flavobacteriales bacterium]
MSQPVPLKVVDMRRETPEAVCLFLEPPAPEAAAFRNFKPGQYLTFELDVPGQGTLRRSYSLCSLPGGEEPLAVAVKKVSGGRGSVYLNQQVKPGDTLKAFRPEGRFTPALEPGRAVHYFLVAGGSGITPIFSILKAVLKTEPQSRITLVYANRHKDSVMFGRELKEFSDANPDRLTYLQALDKPGLFWRGLKGPLQASDFRKIYEKHSRQGLPEEFYVCGPAGMMQEAIHGFVAAGVPREAIILEYFQAPGEGVGTAQGPSPQGASKPTDAKALVALHGKEFQISVPAGTTLLRAAQNAGLDPPYSCEAGVCSTCMARLLEGQVKMVENNILTEKEVQDGYILTCQALCLTPQVKIQYID